MHGYCIQAACLALLTAAVVFAATHQAATHEYAASGLVLAADALGRKLTVSHGEIPGYMEAMVMPFQVRNGKLPATIHPGDTVAFTLHVNKRESWIENVRVIAFASAERDPVLASRLQLLEPVTPPLAIGAEVPSFTLTDQSNRSVTLSSFRGKVIAVDFIYTRCPLPDYCFRLSSNFSNLQKRFASESNLALLTISFDPARDSPEVLARYAKIWNPDFSRWHFLTGSAEDVHRVCAQFGVAYWLDEGLFTHTLHTVIIDRRGRLAANLEGNKFTAKQLGDLVDSVLRPQLHR